ncbi:hypothetical protein ACFYWX_46230 [Streptomyces sp. NPDC002888]|uniref:hypothetical protein n=1 Tax=Streptomyces sp. NPDC002888 TaxID=3364668 RepID=UPI0036885B38
MIEQQGRQSDHAFEARRRRVGAGGFLVGLIAALGFFAFFPGMPHVIDWGAIVVALVVGVVVRWGARAWTERTRRK